MRPISDLQRKVEPFQVISDYVPAGDQPQAIEEIVKRINAGEQDIDQHQSIDNSEESIALISEAQLPTEFGLFKSMVFQNSNTNESHVVLSMDSEKSNKPIVRFHSECLTGDVFGSVRCDCKAQLTNALEQIAINKHGYLIYLKGHEGRGIGIGKKK